MITVLFYEVWSLPAPYTGERIQEGTCSEWNGKNSQTVGAVQLIDQVKERYYRNDIPAIVGWVEKIGVVDPKHITCI